MYKIIITSATYSFLKENKKFKYLLEYEQIKCHKEEGVITVHVEENIDNIGIMYYLLKEIYEFSPNENNIFLYNNEYLKLNDNKVERILFHDFERIAPSPFPILRDIIKEFKITSIQEAIDLKQRPFSGLLPLDQFDYFKFFSISPFEKTPEYIKTEGADVYITNRYIDKNFEVSKANVVIKNCIIDGDIKIKYAERVSFYHCIIMGKIECIDVQKAYFTSVNVSQLEILDSSLNSIDFQNCKIFRFILWDNTIKHLKMFNNMFFEPYLVNLNLQECESKIDISQFDNKKLNFRTIQRIIEDTPTNIEDSNKFYLTFQVDENVKCTESIKDNFVNQVELFLTKGNLGNDNHLYGYLKYQKALYSNSGLKRFLIWLTGALYIPSRWIIFIILNTVIFTMLYCTIPGLKFITINNDTLQNIDFWTSIYYSICQIIGANPTNYNPYGITQIFTTIQTLLNTFYIANLLASITRKHTRD